MVGLGDLEGGRFYSIATSTSSDGRWIVGGGTSAEGSRAVLWHEGKLDALDDSPPPSRTLAWGVSADGSVQVGEIRTLSGARAWIRSNGEKSFLDAVDDLGVPVLARAVSADGRTIAGEATAERGNKAFRWQSGRTEGLSDLAGNLWSSSAHGVSADGSTVVGFSESLWGREAFRWSDVEMLGLGGLSDHHEFISLAHDASYNGEIVVGSSENEQEISEAFIWDTLGGTRSLRDVLIFYYGLDLAGWTLTRATAVSDDGRTIVGSGLNPRGKDEAWIARLPTPSVAGSVLDPPDRDPSSFLVYRSVLGELTDPAGVAVSADGRIYVADSGSGHIRIFDRDGAVLGGWHAGGVPVDAAVAANGLVYVLDSRHGQVHIYTSEGRLLSSWGGLGAAPGELNQPTDLEVDAHRVYVADTGNDRVQVFDLEGAVTTILGDSGAASELLLMPEGVAVDASGRLYVSDRGNHRLQVFDADGLRLRSWGGYGRFPGLFLGPTGVSFHGERIHVVDSGNRRIQVFEPDGTVAGIWGRRALRPREGNGRLHDPAKLAIAPAGNFAVVCEPLEDRCQVYDRIARDAPRDAARLETPRDAPSFFGPHFDVEDHMVAITRPDLDAVELIDLTFGERSIVSVGGPGSRFGRCNRPAGVALDLRRSLLYVSDAGNRRLQMFRFDLDTVPTEVRFVQSLDLHWLAEKLSSDETLSPILAGDLELGEDGRLYLLDRANRLVLVFDRQLSWLHAIGRNDERQERLADPVDLALDPAGERLYVLDAGRGGVRVYDPEGRLVDVWVHPDGPGELLEPSAIRIGADGFVYVADRRSHRVQKYDPRGVPVDRWGRPGLGPGEFHKPRGLAQDGRSRWLVLDWGNRRVQIFSTEGDFLGTFGAALYVRPARLDAAGLPESDAKESG